MGIGHVMQGAFNSHESEHNLINTGKRLPGETLHNAKEKKIISAKEEKAHALRAEFRKASHYKRKVKVTLPEI